MAALVAVPPEELITAVVPVPTGGSSKDMVSVSRSRRDMVDTDSNSKDTWPGTGSSKRIVEEAGILKQLPPLLLRHGNQLRLRMAKVRLKHGGACRFYGGGVFFAKGILF